MAFNLDVFKTRALSAVVFAAVMIGGVFGGHWPFLGLFAVVGVGCAWELFGLLAPHFSMVKRAAFAFFSMTPFWFTASWQSPLDWLPVFVGLALVAELFDEKSEKPMQNVGLLCLGIFYVGAAMAILYQLSHALEKGEIEGQFRRIYFPKKVLGLLVLTWANDTFAYLVGSFLGKTPFFPRISPKKTWEGTIGGAVLTVGLSFVFSLILGEWSDFEWLALGVTVAVFGTLGDLVESMLKRSVGVKDSGALMPGHGGFLDRFDAFIFALPFCWVVLRLF